MTTAMTSMESWVKTAPSRPTVFPPISCSGVTEVMIISSVRFSFSLATTCSI